jgi:PAS domain S-box-containing protein
VIAVLGVDVDAAPLAQKIARERLHPIFITMLLSIILILFFIALRKSIDARSAIARVAKEQSLLLDTIDTQVWYLRDHETYGTVNNAHAAFLGLSKELLEHRSLREIYPDAAARMFIEVNRTLFTEKKPVSTEEWVRDSQGDMRLLDITRTPQIDPLGNVEFVVCSAEDITERNRAEEERALNLQRMHALLHLNQMTDATLQEVTDFALEEAVRMTQSTIGYLAFLNHDESVLTMHSWSKSAMKECAVTNKKIIYPVETTGLWGEAVRQRRPVITNDYSAASPWKKGCPEGHVVIRRHMNIPVFVGPRIVLVAGVGNKAKEYDQDDVRQLTLLMEGMWRLIERKRSETALQESQRILRLVLDTIPVRVFWKDTDSTYLGCNKAFMHDAGLGSTDEIVGKDDFCMPWSSQAQLYRAYDRSVIESGVPMMNYVQPEPRADGNVTWLRTSKTPFHDSEGKIRGILGIYEDITEQKRAEDAQRESDLFLKETQRIARLGGWKANPHTDYLRWSEGVYDIIEAPKDYAPGLAEGLKYFPPEHIPIIEERLSNCLETGESFLLEVEINTYKGRRIWTELRGLAPMVEGERSFVIGTFQDITDRKKSDEERTKLEAQLIHAQKMESLGTLAGGIAHDFNNLLTGILGNVSLVLMGMNGNSQYYERLKNVEEYVQRGSDLTKQLLGFARGGKYEIKATDLGTFIQKSSEMFGRTKKEIHIHYKIQEDLWFVEVDRGQMEQVLLNLYINSWQAMPGGGDMYISVENASLGLMEVSPYGINPGRFVKVTITDTGIGMDKETQTRIFEPFFTTKERGRGSGLGLASVYGIVKNHGGFIEVESEKNLGSSFIIFLPVSEKTEVDDDSIAKDEIRKGNENILVIDDEEMILNVGSKMLEGLGYKVMTATGGTQGLEIYDRSRGSIDLIILDMIMPDFSGKETFHALLRINPSVKVLLSSGYSIDGQAREIMQSGCKGFIQKPFTMLELSKKIRRVLDG